MPGFLHLLTAVWAFGAAVSAATVPRPDSIAAAAGASNSTGIELHLIDVAGLEFAGIDHENSDAKHSRAAAPLFRVDSAPDGATHRYYAPSDSANSVYVGSVTCETSWASPTYSEIDYVVWKVSKQRKRTCHQDNPGGSKCTLLQRYHGGELSICGDPTYGLPCATMAWAGAEIKKQCGNDAMQRAGGYFDFGIRHIRTVIH